MLYPSFGVDTAEANSNGKIVVSHSMEHDSQIYAIQLFNQLTFLYQKAKEAKMNSFQGASKNIENQADRDSLVAALRNEKGVN